MADLIRTLESDLFGGYEWAADLYGDLADVPEAPDRLAVFRGLMRAYEALEGKAAEAMRAAEGLVQAEEDLDDTERALLARLEAPREALFEDPTPARAEAFLAAFDALWIGQAEKPALVPDAILAALCHSNLIAATRNKAIAPEQAKQHHVKAAQLYEELFAMLNFRVGSGEQEWKETAQSAAFRAAVAWRFAGEESRSKRATEIAGAPPGFDRHGHRAA
ncbi:MAG: hypothetical protein QOE90_324 [Thermoplasmata archaeon]|nr:hypothetical protein [Thermoplasmata archaeon]